MPVKTIRSPSLLWKKLLYLGGAAAALALLLLGIVSYLLPRTYDGLGQVIYTDEDGTYQLLLACSNNRFAPEAEVTQKAEVNGEYRMPSRLFINHVDTGTLLPKPRWFPCWITPDAANRRSWYGP